MKNLNKLILIISLAAYSLNISAAKLDKPTQEAAVPKQEDKSRIHKLKQWIQEHRLETAIAIAVIIAGIGTGGYLGYKKFFKKQEPTPQTPPPTTSIEEGKKFEELRIEYEPKLELALNEIKKRKEKLDSIKQKYATASDSEKQELLEEAYKVAPTNFQSPMQSALSEFELDMAIGTVNAYIKEINGDIKDIIEQKKSAAGIQKNLDIALPDIARMYEISSLMDTSSLEVPDISDKASEEKKLAAFKIMKNKYGKEVKEEAAKIETRVTKLETLLKNYNAIKDNPAKDTEKTNLQEEFKSLIPTIDMANISKDAGKEINRIKQFQTQFNETTAKIVQSEDEFKKWLKNRNSKRIELEIIKNDLNQAATYTLEY